MPTPLKASETTIRILLIYFVLVTVRGFFSTSLFTVLRIMIEEPLARQLAKYTYQGEGNESEIGITTPASGVVV